MRIAVHVCSHVDCGITVHAHFAEVPRLNLTFGVAETGQVVEDSKHQTSQHP